MDFTIAGTVCECTFLGKHYRVVVQAGDHRVSVLADDIDLRDKPAPGHALTIGWTRDDAQVLRLDDASRS